MLDEMKTELSLHPGVDFIYADAHGNSETQIAQVYGMLDNIDLLIISPNEEQPLTGVVEEAYRKGIPVIVLDRKTKSSLYTAYIGADNYEIGKLAAKYLGTVSKGQINLLEVLGLPGSSPASERNRGFADGIKKFPNIQIKARVQGNWVKQDAEKKLIQLRPQLGDINAVFAHNDDMALGAEAVLSLCIPIKK
jgi:ABC-type sugar transport system substrate-binding protein